LKHRSFGRCTQGLLAEDERHALIDYIAANPDAGDLMVGTGGARKMRWAVRGKGKSGGVRVITFYSGPPVPVFLLTAFGKGQKIDLTKAERNELRKVLGGVAAEYQKGAKKYVQGRREHPSRRP
jgi:hypothetical protein